MELNNGMILGKVEPIQAAAEAIEHFRNRSNQPEDSLPRCMAQLIAQLHVIAESEAIDFRAVLMYASGLRKADSQRSYEALKARGQVKLTGEGQQ